jgi:hypothetical protein
MAAGQGNAGHGDERAGQTHREEKLAAPVGAPHRAAVLDVDEPAFAEAANRRVRASTDLDGERLDRDVERDDGTRSAPRPRSSTRRRARVQDVRAVKRTSRVGAVGATRVDRSPQRVQHDRRLVRARRRARMQPARTRGHDLDEARTRERVARARRQMSTSASAAVTAQSSRVRSCTTDRSPRQLSNRTPPR